jgi:hypothetical protein
MVKSIYIQKYQGTSLFSKQFTQRSAGFRTQSYKRHQVKQQHSHQQEVTSLEARTNRVSFPFSGCFKSIHQKDRKNLLRLNGRE